VFLSVKWGTQIVCKISLLCLRGFAVSMWTSDLGQAIGIGTLELETVVVQRSWWVHMGNLSFTFMLHFSLNAHRCAL
jgi:hypothetical protein